MQLLLDVCSPSLLCVPPAFALHVVMSSPLHHWVFQRLVHNQECSTPSQNHALPIPGIGVASSLMFCHQIQRLFFSLRVQDNMGQVPSHCSNLCLSGTACMTAHLFPYICQIFRILHLVRSEIPNFRQSYWPGNFTCWVMFLNTLTLNKTKITYSNVLFHSTRLARIPDSGTWCSPLGCPVQDQELDSVIPIGPFQLRKFCDKNQAGFSCI